MLCIWENMRYMHDQRLKKEKCNHFHAFFRKRGGWCTTAKRKGKKPQWGPWTIPIFYVIFAGDLKFLFLISFMTWFNSIQVRSLNSGQQDSMHETDLPLLAQSLRIWNHDMQRWDGWQVVLADGERPSWGWRSWVAGTAPTPDSRARQSARSARWSSQSTKS